MARLDLSGSEKPGQIQENLMAYMCLFAGLPGMVGVDEAGPDGETLGCVTFGCVTPWFVSNRGAPGDCILRAGWGEEGG